MVKNTQGGSSHKKFARKHSSASKSYKLRLSEDEGEIYAVVTKMLGNGMFHCYCIDEITRLGHIRGKFSGRGKRDNMVEVGKWLLIGLREWDISKDKKVITGKEKLQQCDLLEVYSDSDKSRLKETVVENWYLLDNNDISNSKETIDGNNEIAFISAKDEEREQFISEMNSATTEKIKFNLGDDQNNLQEEEVYFDDI